MMKRARAFTLVEIMIVVAIIALLAAIAIPNLLRARLNANDAAAKASLQALVTAVESYAAGEGNYPDNESDMTSANPKYLNEAICGEEKHGYNFTCTTLDTTEYNITATAVSCNTSGSNVYNVGTGNVWTTIDCT